MSDDSPSPIPDLLAHRALLRALALRMSGRPEDADELVQETLLVGMERPPQGDADAKAWLRGILRRLWFRRRGRAARARATELDPALPARTVPAGADLERAEVVGRLTRLVEELEEPYRTVVRLRYYEDRSPSEIAARLGRPVNTITSQLARAPARLRERVERRDGRRTSWSLGWFLGRDGTDEARGSLQRSRAPARSRALQLAVPGAVALVLVFLIPLFLARRAEVRHGGAADAAVPVAPAPGARLESIQSLPAREALDAIHPMGWVELEVLDEAGEPLVGASLEVTHAEGADEHEGHERISYTPGGETDARGRLRFPLDANVVTWHEHDDEPSARNGMDWIGFRLKKEDLFAYYHWLAPQTGGSLRFPLGERSAYVQGRVLDLEGRPLESSVYEDLDELPELLADGSLLMEAIQVAPS